MPSDALPPARPQLWPRQRPLSRPTLGDVVYDLDFVHGATAASLAAAGFTFTRASSAWDATGVSYATDVPRITSAGLLLEGARTNLCLRSQEFDDAVWTKTGSSITANAATAPDGALTADTFTESASNASLRPASAITIVAGTTYTASIFLKRGNTDWARFLVGDSTAFTNGARLWVNLATGALGINTVAGSGATFTSASVAASGSGWYRVTLTFSYASSTTLYVGAFTASANNSTTRADVGGGAGIGGYFHVWQCQVEAGAFVSSPIVTTSASVSRAVDVCIATRSNALLAQGSAVVSVTTAAGVEADQVAWSIDNNNSNNQTRLTLYRNFSANSLHLFLTDANVTQASIGSGASSVASLENHTAALRWAVNDVAMVMDGGTVGTDTSATMPSAIAYERLGGRVSTDRPFNAYIRRVIRSHELWPDAVLRARSGSS